MRRFVLRLLDDFAALRRTLSYGTGMGTDSSDRRIPLLRAVNVANNVVDQAYYPLDHLAWAKDKGLVRPYYACFFRISPNILHFPTMSIDYKRG